MKNDIKYRIQTNKDTFKYAGTGENSWFDLSTAKQKVDYSKGEKIVEVHPLYGVMWEVL